jgi:uncharacterized protein YaeQ
VWYCWAYRMASRRPRHECPQPSGRSGWRNASGHGGRRGGAPPPEGRGALSTHYIPRHRCPFTPPACDAVAQSPTIYQFDIELANVDRHTYETLSFRVACQPSETPDFLLTRVLAYCLEYQEGITFGKGFTEPGEPSLAIHDLTGTMTTWIEIGAPDPTRLHKASLTVPRVVLYTHKDPRTLLPQLAAAKIHRADRLEVYSLDRGFLEALGANLERRTRLGVSVSDAQLYVTVGDATFTAGIERHLISNG